MDPIQHSHYQPRKKNTAKVNVTISLVIHLIIFALGAYWAAHEGVLGKKLQDLSVGIIPKEKKLEEKKPETKEAEGPKKEEIKQKIQDMAKTAPPPPKFVAPAAANEGAAPPPAVVIPDFAFDRDTIAGADPIGLYKQQVENLLRSHWDRPTDVQDLSFVAEVEMAVDPSGKITGYTWQKGSGDQRWDNSVKQALASAKSVSRRPPQGFPEKFTVRFDVTPSTEPLISRAD